MATEGLDIKKDDLCSRIEELIALLNNAESSLKQGDFDTSADILKTVQDQVNEVEEAARSTKAEADKTKQTPWEQFKRPILEVLVQEGGSARNWQVFQYLEEHLRLTEGDMEPHVAETRETEWQHGCRIAANIMRQEPLCYLEPTRTPGMWTITDAGRRHLEELQRQD